MCRVIDPLRWLGELKILASTCGWCWWIWRSSRIHVWFYLLLHFPTFEKYRSCSCFQGCMRESVCHTYQRFRVLSLKKKKQNSFTGYENGRSSICCSIFLATFLQLRWLIRTLYLNSSWTSFFLHFSYWSHTGWMHMNTKKFFFSIPINLIPLMFVLVYVHQRYLEV